SGKGAPNGGGAVGIGTSAVSQTRMAPGGQGAATMRLVQAEPEVSPEHAPTVHPEPVPAKTADAASGIRSLQDIAALADAHRDGLMKAQIRRCIRPVRIEAGSLDVSLTDDAPRTLLNDLATKLQTWTGRRWVVSLSREE